ncbi:hypothetical protein GYB62_00515, partial [bacterium]|nr:hypothetical protein [bacterium]
MSAANDAAEKARAEIVKPVVIDVIFMDLPLLFSHGVGQVSDLTLHSDVAWQRADHSLC